MPYSLHTEAYHTLRSPIRTWHTSMETNPMVWQTKLKGNIVKVKLDFMNMIYNILHEEQEITNIYIPCQSELQWSKKATDEL